MKGVHDMNNKKFVPSLIWAKGKKSGYYYKIEEGTGDNLLKEDLEEGYIDYINYEFYDSLEDINENNPHDGGMFLLKKYYQDMTVEEIIACIEYEETEKLEVIEAHG